MLGWIHVDDDTHVTEARNVGRALVHGCQRDAGFAQELVRPLGDVCDVGVLHDGPEGLHTRDFPARDRLGLSELGEKVMGRPAIRIEGRVE